MKTLQIKQLSPNAKLPTRTHATDAGLDIYAAEDTQLVGYRASIVPTGIAINIPEGYEGQIRPRSGKSVKTNMRVILGTIDAGYNAEIGVIAESTNGGSYLVQKGEKIAQLVIQRVELPTLDVVDEFDTKTDRGSKGFGSSDEVHP